MEVKEILRLLLPVVSIIVGFIIRKSNNPNLESVKKYWLFFIIVGALLFLFRLYKFLKS